MVKKDLSQNNIEDLRLTKGSVSSKGHGFISCFIESRVYPSQPINQVFWQLKFSSLLTKDCDYSFANPWFFSKRIIIFNQQFCFTMTKTHIELKL